jgi:hypothetical protein
MIIREIDSRGSLGRGALVRNRTIDVARGYRGHNHFWQRAFSRRQFIQAGSAAAGALVLGSQGLLPASAAVPGNTPKAIPGGFTTPDTGTTVFHNFAPGVFDPLNTDRSGIFDFNGNIGYAIIDGMGTGRDTVTHTTTRLPFEVDARFMQGVYVGTDGRRREGTFALI